MDPETHVFYSQANTAQVTTGSIREPPPEFKTDIKYVSGVKGREFRIAEGPGFGSAADAPQRGGRTRAKADVARRRRLPHPAARRLRRAPRAAGVERRPDRVRRGCP